MANIIKLDKSGLLDYVKAGKEAKRRVATTMRRLLNVGRKVARQRITSEFKVQTGFLRRQARKLQTKVSIKPYEIKGRVGPTPRLMNIFERGATLAYGRGRLEPRPVVDPARNAMQKDAAKEFDKVLHEVGK